MTLSAETLLQERETRVARAIALETPDRVPLLLSLGFFPARYKGMSIREAMYDGEKILAAWVDTNRELQPDMFQNPFATRFLGSMLEALDFKQLAWAGHGLGENEGYQFLENEYMQRDEYDELLFDPTDFIVRKYWPRIFGALAVFQKLPPLREILTYTMGLTHLAALDTPEMRQAVDRLFKAARAASTLIRYSAQLNEKMKALGFPILHGSFTQAPFDTLSDYLRGTRGSMLDMFRQPQKLQAAVDKLYPPMLQLGLAALKRGVPRVFIPIHKCLDDFMSQKQFTSFYWPTLQRLLVDLIEAGLTPHVLWEGDVCSRLAFIGEIPPAKAIYHFESTDIAKAKAMLKNKVCVMGGVPISLLCAGTPAEVRAHIKELIATVGRDGGFILDAATNVEDAKVENVKAMVEAAREYGVY